MSLSAKGIHEPVLISLNTSYSAHWGAEEEGKACASTNWGVGGREWEAGAEGGRYNNERGGGHGMCVNHE
jgi:hypothetical protein